MAQTQPGESRRPRAEPPRMVLTSAAFADGNTIAVRHTADGEDVWPHLSWSAPPIGTQSIAIVCEDPRAPSASVPEKAAMYGIIQGENGFATLGWGGPPPGEPHRYVLRIYALDKQLGLEAGADRGSFDEAIEAHILAEGRLIGMYRR